MKIVIGMSGGIDSSVAAALFKERGARASRHNAQALEGDPAKGIEWYERSCCKVDVARAVAQRLGIQFTVVNIQEEFEREIIDEFCKEYILGRTPNPCIRCNEKIKFGLLLKRQKSSAQRGLLQGTMRG